jgi:hypothetical protein
LSFAWDQLAASMRRSDRPVSAFFLIDSHAATTRMFRHLAALDIWGITPDVLHVVHACAVRKWHERCSRSGCVRRQRIKLRFQAPDLARELPGYLTVRDFDAGLEAELVLPGLVAAQSRGFLGNGHDGFFCAFLPPPVYSSLW